MYAQRFIAACDDHFLFHTIDRGLITDKEVVAEPEKQANETAQNNE